MPYLRLYTCLLILVFIFSGCSKDISKKECRELKEAMQTSNEENAKNIINHIINSLPSQEHTEENLARLASSISNECDFTAQVLCFGCIKTLPEQSEIRISVNLSGTQLSKTIDISYSSDNKMKFVNMHD